MQRTNAPSDPASTSTCAGAWGNRGWSTNSRRGDEVPVPTTTRAPDLPGSRAYTWAPSQRPTNCRFGVLPPPLLSKHVHSGFFFSIFFSINRMCHSFVERACTKVPCMPNKMPVYLRFWAWVATALLRCSLYIFYLTKEKKALMHVALHAYKAKGCYCYFSQIQGKYNSNLAYTKKKPASTWTRNSPAGSRTARLGKASKHRSLLSHFSSNHRI